MFSDCNHKEIHATVGIRIQLAELSIAPRKTIEERRSALPIITPKVHIRGRKSNIYKKTMNVPTLQVSGTHPHIQNVSCTVCHTTQRLPPWLLGQSNRVCVLSAAQLVSLMNRSLSEKRKAYRRPRLIPSFPFSYPNITSKTVTHEILGHIK